MTAPDKIWIAPDAQPYHHQRVVDELVGALKRLEANCSSHAAKVGPQHAWWDDIFDARALIAKHRNA